MARRSKSDMPATPSVEWRVRFVRKLIASHQWGPRVPGRLARRWDVTPAMIRVHAAEARRQLRSADEAHDDAKLFQELVDEAVELARDAGGVQGARLLLEAADKVAKRGGIYKAEKLDVRHKKVRALADIAEARRKAKSEAA